MKAKPALLLAAFAVFSPGITALAGPDADVLALRAAIVKDSGKAGAACPMCSTKAAHYVLAHGKGNVVAKR